MYKSRSFTHFSCNHMVAMYQFARAAKDIEAALDSARVREHGSFVLSTITSSVAFLESLINEIFMLGRSGYYRKLDSASLKAMANLWDDDVASRLPVLAKFELALALNHCPPFDHGGAPYQDAALLMKLRNEVVHYKIGWRNHADPEPIRLEKLLKKKFPPNAYVSGHRVAFFPSQCLGAGCAVWAVESARAVADEFHRRLGTKGFYQLLAGLPALG